MFSYIPLFLRNLLVPLIMFLAGYLTEKHPPKKENGWIGYRTELSRKNRDTWEYSQKLCRRIFRK